MDCKITFGMIVLNGEPFVRYNLRALYPFAHQIIVVEGACPTAAAVATPDGHSTDGTLNTLNEFKHNEDPDNKIIIVSAHDAGYVDGFWPEKDEMSIAYAKRATGYYLWQVDSDEFYHEEQMRRLIDLLERDRPDAVSFPTHTIWGSTKYITNSFYLIRDNAREFHRLFAWEPGCTYVTHRPPTVLDAQGIDTRKKAWLRAKDLERRGIFLFHYSLLFPRQVFNKISYYKGRVPYAIDSWEESVYRRLEKPYRIHNVYQHIGWLEPFDGEHPRQITLMMNNIATGKTQVEIRNCQDVEQLLSKRGYQLASKTFCLIALIMSHQPFYFFYRAYESCKCSAKKLWRYVKEHN